MDTLTGWMMGQANRGKEMKVFDWDKAARLIREQGATEAEAGLSEDWGYTGGAILAAGQPVPREETYVYLASTWATPELSINGETVACYRMESEAPGWSAETYWPESALKILRGE